MIGAGRAVSVRLFMAFVFGAGAGAVAAILLTGPVPNPDAMKSELLAKPEFLADQPDILERVRTVLLNRKLAAEGSERVELIRDKWQFLTKIAFTPTIGQLKSTRVLLEFTDYACVPCRASAPIVREAVAAGKDLRVAVLPYPIEGALAEYAARIAVAAYRQDPYRFAALHARLMEDAGPLTQQRILSTVQDLHFDVDQVEREAQSDEIRRYLEQVRSFFEDMRLSGVPAFLMDEKLVAGGIGAAELQALIERRDEPAAPDKARLKPGASSGDRPE